MFLSCIALRTKDIETCEVGEFGNEPAIIVEDAEEEPVAGRPDSFDVCGTVTVLKSELIGP